MLAAAKMVYASNVPGYGPDRASTFDRQQLLANPWVAYGPEWRLPTHPGHHVATQQRGRQRPNVGVE
jgi:hypothetical protein